MPVPPIIFGLIHGRVRLVLVRARFLLLLLLLQTQFLPQEAIPIPYVRAICTTMVVQPEITAIVRMAIPFYIRPQQEI